MSKTAAGGAATVNGVIYQMLWALLRAARLNALSFARPADDAPLDGAVLVLEPRGGGGDVQEIAAGRRVVEQLKAKAGDGTWSLRAVVEDVLPDLFLARDPKHPEAEYLFGTEGRRGDWDKVYAFFQGLKARGDAATAIAGLDDASEVKFRRRKAKADAGAGDEAAEDEDFWPLEKYTEKTLFARIVEVVKGRPAVAKFNLADQDVALGVWASGGVQPRRCPARQAGQAGRRKPRGDRSRRVPGGECPGGGAGLMARPDSVLPPGSRPVVLGQQPALPE